MVSRSARSVTKRLAELIKSITSWTLVRRASTWHTPDVLPTLRIGEARKLPELREARPASTLVTVAGSAGAFDGLRQLVAALPRGLKSAIAVMLHTGPGSTLADSLAVGSQLPVRYGQSGLMLREGCVYVARPCTHLIVNPDASLTVSEAAPVRRFRPSADWLFESAAASFGERHMAVILSGMLSDGAHQLRAVKRLGGTVLAQSPSEARFPDMPEAAIATGFVDKVMSIGAMPAAIGEFVELRAFG
jgi:chemotaxis response regulator CheB